MRVDASKATENLAWQGQQCPSLSAASQSHHPAPQRLQVPVDVIRHHPRPVLMVQSVGEHTHQHLCSAHKLSSEEQQSVGPDVVQEIQYNLLVLLGSDEAVPFIRLHSQHTEGLLP
ncbi:uncharacterized protein LOC144465102 [Epinephelus lanceolatus]